MSESNMRYRITGSLRELDAVPVENSAMIGTPDVNFIGGWMELKWLRRWPARDTTIVRVEHFTLEQRQWLRRRSLAGEDTWLLLQVRREWLLFEGPVAAQFLGHYTREYLIKVAHTHWANGLIDQELVGKLSPHRQRQA